MFSFPYVNTLTWADILSEKLRPKTNDEFELMNWNLKWWSWPLNFSIRITCLFQPIMHFITPLRRITKPPTTDHRPTDKCSTDYRPTYKCFTDSPKGPPPTHRTYYNWSTTLSLTNLILTESPLDQFFQ